MTRALKITIQCSQARNLTHEYLSLSLGSDYLKELEVGAKAQYNNYAIISEFLQGLSAVIEEDQLSKIAVSTFYSVLVDTSTDISVKKQLILVVHYLKETDIKTAFFHTKDIINGTANTVTQAILPYIASQS